MNRNFFLFITLLLAIMSQQQVFSQGRNFDNNGHKMIRFSKTGDAIDAHDGEIAQFNGVYYLYGTSYDCGFQWGNKAAPFCGFKVYTSTDLETWTDKGYLFDATTPVWQTRCDGKTYGCFRPHVIYNKKTKQYVLWINVYDNVSGYRVFTSATPTGPFTEVAEPALAVNSSMPAAGLNNGDHDTFVDDDGTAYLAYTDWRSNGSIVIEKLSDDYLTGSGQVVQHVTPGATEAPGLFKRDGRYYVVYSDPNCGYCSGTGTAYRTAPTPLGPWSEGKKISDNSCGGQPSFVSVIKLNAKTVYLYGSDLWNNAAKNEALADYYWAPLTFAADGSIEPLQCKETYRQPKGNTSLEEGFHPVADITDSTQRKGSFTGFADGKLAKMSITLFKLDNPDQPLEVQLFKTDAKGEPEGNALYSGEIAAAEIGWSPKSIWIQPRIHVKKGANYIFTLKTRAGKGAYGVAIKEDDGRPLLKFEPFVAVRSRK
ncbi:hypothetical protein DCC81_14785 [Chitinophaga parva]|uniref:Glycosyl hydrolase family 43 n=1 Tax=Chitinophaga parva TaxID=2169414 RepID=A0A2T7BGZ1_9BACT|nr:family 43 glycosylhydrolase [Chitinophaga parva]PUZ25545.1 hypothetical protein DCC81_14785 [Chitinophaga parva]